MPRCEIGVGVGVAVAVRRGAGDGESLRRRRSGPVGRWRRRRGGGRSAVVDRVEAMPRCEIGVGVGVAVAVRRGAGDGEYNVHPIKNEQFQSGQEKSKQHSELSLSWVESKQQRPVPLGEMPCYYNVDDILMEEELISVVFQVTANGVGMLDPGAERNSHLFLLPWKMKWRILPGSNKKRNDLILYVQVEKGAKVDLPFWLAHGMLSLEQAVSINVPPCFTQKTRKEIQADAACVDLRVRCPHFYELGCKIVPLVGDKSIGQFLRYAFTSRYKEGIDVRLQEVARRGCEAAEGVHSWKEEEDKAARRSFDALNRLDREAEYSGRRADVCALIDPVL
ncbi:hypothetical protein TRIUR3_20793 [Triticum urartu]|uniref:GINS subunit domain-containing protein n=1 Tax=Triticum urartu TaxID=4572 RepID=M7ZI67_TRIUA|nr:hypothetical protein TRIUR3_20793 [Triticum urartu]